MTVVIDPSKPLPLTSDVTADLERAIDAITASYDGPEEINNLESAAMPNKRAVIEAFNHLKPAIFLGFYSRRSLSRDNLRYSLAEHLYPAYENLALQIQRAVTYEQSAGRCPAREASFAHEVTMDLFDAIPRLRRLLNEDARAAFEHDPAARSFEEVVFSYPAMEAITAHRIAHELYRTGVPIIPRILSEHAHSLTGIDINPGARIGSRFFIDHGTGVVIGETAEIGNDVKMYQGVTLGALSTHRTSGDCPQKRHPTIENNVTIYAGATILGGETVIGEGSVIGGNVWLMSSVPPGSKIFGRARE
jgi:serine O-acetyltransferase